MLPPRTVTPCAIQADDTRPCTEAAHVVLFAPADMNFAGRHYAHGDRVLTCLRHGATIYDTRRHVREQLAFGAWPVPAWIKDALRTNSLPVPHLPIHGQSEVTPRPTSRWDRPRKPYREREPRGDWARR